MRHFYNLKQPAVAFIQSALFALLCIIAVAPAFAQSLPVKNWDSTLGGSGWDSFASVKKTSDGGYILGGISVSNRSYDKSEWNQGSIDLWVVKVNSSGAKVWDNTIGGTGLDYFTDVIETADGGYLVGGYSSSGVGADKTAAFKGGEDYWIVKLNSSGVVQWDKTFGGTGFDVLNALQETSDGGFILGGYSNSGANTDKTEWNQGSNDYWVVKVDSLGIKEWDKTVGGAYNDYLQAVRQTSDGGYILGGISNSGIGGNKTEPEQGGTDYWVVKLSSTGTFLWDKSVGGYGNDNLKKVFQVSDGGYILGGTSYSGQGGNKSEASKGGADCWLVKLNSSGAIQWNKTFGGSGDDSLNTVIQASDGGYIFGGTSVSGISGDKSEASQGSSDFWIIKTNSTGTKEWDKRYGGSQNDELYEIQQGINGSYVLGGATNSGISGDKITALKGNYDYWLVNITVPSPPVISSFSPDTAQVGFDNPPEAVRVTVLPAHKVSGPAGLITGADTTIKSLLLLADPYAFVTLILPDVAPAGMVAVI